MHLQSELLRHLLLGALIGLPAAAAYFAALRQNVRLYIEGGSSAVAVTVQLLRLALMGALFFGLAKVGVGALVGALAGFVLMRSVAMRRVMRAS